MSISILIPTFNRAHLLGETIDSVLGQTRQVDEILVIDDGSSDDTAGVVRSYEGALTYLRQENAGKSAALNTGLSRAKGDLIWICDDDDILAETACQQLVDQLESDPSLDFACGRHDDFTVDPVNGKKTYKPAGIDFASSSDAIFSDLLEGCHIFQPGLIVRKSVYDSVGPFREDLLRSQDYEMILRIARGHRGVMVDDIVFHYREHPGTRGPAQSRFDWSERYEVWRSFAEQIFRPLLADLDDAELLPESLPDVPTEPNALRRARCLKRATVYSRHGLWREAAEIWHHAASEFSAGLTEFERQLVRRSTEVQYLQLFSDAQLKKSLWSLGRSGQLGYELKWNINRSLRWRIRQALRRGDVGELTKFVQYFYSTSSMNFVRSD